MVYDGDSINWIGHLGVPFASFHYAVIRDTFLYTASTGSYGLHCINIANPESIFVVCTAPYFFGEYGMEVIDSFVYTATPANAPIGPEPTDDSRPNWRISIVKLIGDTSAVGESLLFVENRCYGGIGSNGEHLFYVNNYLSDFFYPGTDQVLGPATLGIWGTDYSYTWTEPDSEIVFGIGVLNEFILAVGFEHGFSIINYTDLDSIREVAYYRDTDTTFRFTHFALKDERLYAMAHPIDGISRMYMFELDEEIVTGQSESSLPQYFRMRSFPNPFNSSVKFALEGEFDSPLRIEIYDVNGRQIAELLDSRFCPNGNPSGHGNDREIVWEPKKDLPSGIYFVRLLNENDVLCGKVVYLR